MHSRARGAFAQVIEQADELHLGAVGVRQAEDLQPVQPGQLVGSQEAAVGTLVQRMDRDHLLPCVILGQGIGHLLGGQAQSGQIQRDHRLHTGVVIGHHRHESRRGSQAGDGGHLGQVLVVQCQAVGAGRVKRGIGAFGLILGDHLFAAARVAGQAGAVQQPSSTSGATGAIKPVAWQPGTATRVAVFSALRVSCSSGRP